jgi:LPS-assembly lipoprotein
MRRKPGVNMLLVVLAGALLSACGFQLQGRQRLPPHLRRSLDSSGARLVDAAGSDGAVVRILIDRVTENVLSVDARNIPTDYELIYQVEVEVRAAGQELMAAEEFMLSRIYSYNETVQLAKEREKDVLREALARDMASVVLRRLSSL